MAQRWVRQYGKRIIRSLLASIYLGNGNVVNEMLKKRLLIIWLYLRSGYRSDAFHRVERSEYDILLDVEIAGERASEMLVKSIYENILLILITIIISLEFVYIHK